MESVHPIRDRRKIEAIEQVLKTEIYNQAYYVLFVLGINSGLRCRDLLNLTQGDVAESRAEVKDQLRVQQSDVGHCQYFSINEPAKQALLDYLQTRPFDATAPLFPSRKGGRPLKRTQVWKVLNQAAQMAGIEEHIGTQSLRKTFAYHAYQSGMDIAYLQKLLNHRSQAATLKYIGVAADEAAPEK